MKNGTFKLVNVDKIFEGTRIFRSKFIGTVKTVSSCVRYKSRLLAQDHGDWVAVTIAIKALIVQQLSERLVSSIAASLENMICRTRDITQAYTKCTTSLEREVFIRPPIEMGLQASKVLKLVIPLYGVQESGLHCYLTYM